MRTKKRIFVVIFTVLILVCSTLFCACDKEPFLLDYVSDLRSDLYFAESENLKLRACYGIKEINHENDGKINKKYHYFSFKLLNKETENISYEVTFTLNGITYSEKFAFSPVSNSLIATIEVDECDIKTLSVDVSYSSNTETLVLNSIVPDGTLSYIDTMRLLEEKQSELIDSYKNTDGLLDAEVKMRVIVKGEKPYWYVAFVSKSGNVKALLVDGKTGEILAVRSIF